MREYWEENLHALDRDDLIKRLKKISAVFLSLNLPLKYDKDQLYFIADTDFDIMHIGLSKEPFKILSELSSYYNKKMILLYYFDPVEEHKKLMGDNPDIKIAPRYRTPQEIRDHQISWLTGKKHIPLDNQPYFPDDRALKILVKKGMIYLKELMDYMGIDYRKA